MTGIDWLIIGVFLISIIIGIMRGFVREALSIISWVVAIWLGITFCGQVGEFIAQYVPIRAENFRIWAGFAAVFIVCLFVFSMISYLVAKLLVKGGIKGTDRVLGVGFGVLRAIAIMAFVVVLGRGFGMTESDFWTKSQYIAYFDSAADFLEDVLPEKLHGFRVDEDNPQNGVNNPLKAVDEAIEDK